MLLEKITDETCNYLDAQFFMFEHPAPENPTKIPRVSVVCFGELKCYGGEITVEDNTHIWNNLNNHLENSDWEAKKKPNSSTSSLLQFKHRNGE